MRHRKPLTRTKLESNGAGRVTWGGHHRSSWPTSPGKHTSMGWGLAACKPSRAGTPYWGQKSTGPELNWYQTVLVVSTAPIAPAFESVGPRLDDSQTAFTARIACACRPRTWINPCRRLRVLGLGAAGSSTSTLGSSVALSIGNC